MADAGDGEAFDHPAVAMPTLVTASVKEIIIESDDNE